MHFEFIVHSAAGVAAAAMHVDSVCVMPARRFRLIDRNIDKMEIGKTPYWHTFALRHTFWHRVSCDDVLCHPSRR